MSYKLFDLSGLTALISTIKQIRTTAGDNAAAVSDLGDDMQGLTRQLADALGEIEQYLTENIAVMQEFTLEVTGWTEDNSVAAYPYKYVFAAEGVTVNSRADAVLDAASADIAANCQMSTTSETAEGSVIFRSRTRPASAISGQLYITMGAGSAASGANQT